MGPHQDGLLAEGDHVVDAGGLRLAYHVHGQGPTCVVHPGGPGLDWAYDRMPLLEHELTVVYLEPMGSGASQALPSPEDYTLARYVEALEAFRAALGLERFLLLGHSHGGFVAQLYAIAHADRLSGLILYDTAPRIDDEFGETAGRLAKQFFGDKPWFADAAKALDSEDSARSDDEMTAILGRELPLYFADFDGHAEAYRKAFAGVRAAVAPIHSLNPSKAAFDVRSALTAVRVPALILVGRRDFITSVSFAEEMHAALAGSTLVVLEHSGHMGYLEETEAFVNAVRSFANRAR
jgi:pimeloyl-ACP methyl ester carboxylesterase